ncbi:MAG: HD domain-containing phosphohydrolase, partial [Thermodesulfobacteriota bacterium]
SSGNHRVIHVMEDITEEKKAAQSEQALFDFIKEVTSDMDLGFRLRKICEVLIRIGYKMAWVGTLKEDTKDIIPFTHAGFEDGYLAGIKIKYDDSELGKGPTGRAVKNKKPEIQNHILNDPRYAPWRDNAVKRGYKSSAAFPVMKDGKCLAVINVYSDKERFTDAEAMHLETFSNQCAVYIMNSMLFSDVKASEGKLRGELEITGGLLSIADAVSNKTDMDKMMRDVTERCRAIMRSDICLSYLWDRKYKIYRPSHCAGLQPEFVPIFKTEALSPKTGFVEDAARGETVFHLPPGDKIDGSILPFLQDVETLAVMLLAGRSGPLGLIIGVCAKQGFTERETALMKGISQEVSTALDEARLYKESVDRSLELSAKVETISAMREIDRALLSTLDSNEIVEVAARMITRLVSCDRVTVALVDRTRGGFIYEAGFGVSFLKKGSFVRFEDTSVTDVVKTGRPQYTANLADSEDLLPIEASLVKEGFRSQIRMPLVLKDGITGVLTIGSKRVAAFGQKDLSNMESIANQISVALENARLLKDLDDLFIGTIRSLSEAIDAKSKWTAGHSKRVTEIAVSMGKEMGFDEAVIKRLELAGLLHDLGKIGTYEYILDKPGKLTKEEQAVMREHPGKGADILQHIKQLKDIMPAIRHHHEYYDGTGYPDGLKGDAIPLFARILAVADTVDAMAADRPYRKGRDEMFITEELKRCSGAQFDPAVVDVFLKIENKGS